MSTQAFRPWTPSPELLRHVQELAFQQTLSADAQAYVESALTKGPSRAVQSRRGNVITQFYSPKMKTSIKLESRTGEFPMAARLESDSDVLAYMAQPPRVSLTLLNEHGKATTTTPYTPDFLVVRTDRIEVIETRDDGELSRRSLDNPYQFYKDDSGQWHYRGAEEHFARLGFTYRLVANSQHPAVLIENERFLEDYVNESCPPLKDEVALAIRTHVTEARFVTMSSLLDAGFKADDIFKALVNREVFVDLNRSRLSATDELVLYADEPTARAMELLDAAQAAPPAAIQGSAHIREGSRIATHRGEWIVVKVDDANLLIREASGTERLIPVASVLSAIESGAASVAGVRHTPDARSVVGCSREQLADAMDRLRAVRARDTSRWSARSLERYAGKIAMAANDLEATMALVDNSANRGNRNPKLLPKNLEIVAATIREFYNAPRQMTKKGAYAAYLVKCKDAKEDSGQKVNPASYATFCRYCNLLKDVGKRMGKRAAYQLAPIADVLVNQFPVHGVRPHEVCYVDHTIANIATVSADDVPLGKPTLTVAVDGHTTQPRAMYLSYDKPSTRTVLMIIRDYVRRHGRLPRVLAVDNGAEFRSHELSDLCRMLGIDLRFRPPGMPRGGAMVERLIGAVEEEVLALMEGNTRMLKTGARLVTKSIDPFRRAEWTLPAVYGAIEKYLFEVRPNRIHPVLGVTPNEFEKRRIAETGEREHRHFTLSDELKILTSPHARRRFHVLDRQRGIWVNGLWYRHPKLWEARLKEKLEVRVEPWDARVIYVRVKNAWIKAMGASSRWLGLRSSREVEIALRRAAGEAAARANAQGASASTSVRMGVLEPHHFDSRLAAEASEMRYLYGPIGMGAALPLDAEDVDSQPLEAGPAPIALAVMAPAPVVAGEQEAANDYADEFAPAGDLRQAGFL
jgi:putative transposase